MNIEQLNEQVSVSGQISVEDVKVLVDEGVKIIVCNRPDDEDPSSPNFASIEKAAKDAGIEAINIPFPSSEMQPSHIEQFKAVLERGVRTHAYCRSGRRSAFLLQSSI